MKETHNQKINLTGTAMYESEFLVLRKRSFQVLKVCAPQIPAGYFCR